MSAINNRAARIGPIDGRTDYLAHNCKYSGNALQGIVAGKGDSRYQVLVFDESTTVGPALILTVNTLLSPMAFHDLLTPTDARTLAAGLIAAADHHDEITAREAEALAGEAVGVVP